MSASAESSLVSLVSDEEEDVIDLTQSSSSEASADELSSDRFSEDDIEYLNDNKCLPIFSRQSKVRTSSLYIIQAILDAPSDLISSTHPTNVDINCAFVVDTSQLRDAADIKCDDCGVWKQTKTATTRLMVQFTEDGSVTSVKTLSGTNYCKGSYLLVRRHYICKSAPDLSRHISTLTNRQGKMEPFQFIQYRFSGNEHFVNVQAHGNSKKSDKPYKRTCPSTLKDLEEETKVYPPKRAAFRVEQRRGGIFNATCEGDLPRNYSQVSRIRSKKASVPSALKPSDPLQALVIKFKEQKEDPNHFIQSIQLIPDPTIVLFNKVQLDEMQQFCTCPGKTSVVGVDVTFNLGPFYVTMCTYQNFKVINKSGIHPIMIGPTLIHSTKNHSNFAILFQEIVKKKPSLSSLKAYGTDGEQAIAKAASESFPFAVHLRCANHLRDNITVSLKKMLIPDAMIKQILADVFGTSVEKGLIHASSTDFSAKLKIIENRWDALQKLHNVGTSGVFKWFKINVAPIIRDNLNAELLASIGVDGEKYTQNNSEATNALVKRYVNFQKQDVFQFVNDLEECVLEQQNEVSKSVLGLGRWNLAPSYSHAKQSGDRWFSTMTQVEKQEAVSVFRAENLSVSECGTNVEDSTDARHSLAAEHSLDASSNGPVLEYSQSDSSEHSLSIPYKSLVTTLSETELKSLWSKASRLLTDKKVITVPGSNSKVIWVASDSSASPHVVTLSKTGNGHYMCDNQCVGWKSRGICSHCLAAAELNNELFEFLVWFRSSKVSRSDASLTKAVYHGTYKHAGKKKPTRRKYGDAVHLPVSEKTDRIPLTDSTNIFQDHCYAKPSLSAQKASQFGEPSFVPLYNASSSNNDTSRSHDSTQLHQSDVSALNPSTDSVDSSVNVSPDHHATKLGCATFSLSQRGLKESDEMASLAQSPQLLSSITSSLSSILSAFCPQFSPSVSPSALSVKPSIASVLNPFSTSPSAPGTQSQSSSRVSYPQKPVTTKSDKPFFLTLLNNRIKKCSGCGHMFRDLENPCPHEYFILGHLERDWFPGENFEWRMGSFQNKYYHLRASCVLLRCPVYRFPDDIKTIQVGTTKPIPSNVKIQLLQKFKVQF